jgi:hypothetical protein
MSTWYTMPDKWPTDGQEVWVRMYYWFNPSFKAVFHAATQNFTTLDGYNIPWYEIARWKKE